jgi:tetratricopeptide (TPR) repeat protein
MKYITLLVLVSFFVFGCATTGKIDSPDNNSGYTTEYESMDIKSELSVPMVAPTENKKAMEAYNRGTNYLMQNRLNEAERYLKEAIELDPLFVDAMDHLGMVYRRQNRLSEAEGIYLRSIGLNNRNTVPYQNLAIVYRMQNRLNDAFEQYKKIIQIDPDDPEGYYGMGELYYIDGDYDNSMIFIDKTIELYINLNSPYVYDAFFYKGMIYYRINNYEEALKYLEEARKGNPNNATIERTINEIKNKQV